MIEYLHPVSAPLGSTVALTLILLGMITVAVYESRNVTALHLMSWQELQALVFKLSV